MTAQKLKILNLLQAGGWICTSQMYALYIADVRRRLCDLQKDGYELENRKCQQHDYHTGGSKEWRLKSQKVSLGVILPPTRLVETRVEELSQSKLFNLTPIFRHD